ncbi:MAG: LapA family protein [Spirochaetes bacterium]|nr:LapA family protein [Spirochaetota bacterium]
MSIYAMIFIFIACGTIIICLQNMHETLFRIFFWDVKIPTIVLIFITLIIGFTAGYLSSVISTRKDHTKKSADK